MATDKQIAANRRNSQLSTGPRSLAGVARSSQNAISHGLTSSQAVLPGESKAEFNGLRAAVFASLLPSGALENQLVERIVSLIWRLRRVQVFEVALFQWMAHLQAAIHDPAADKIEICDVERRNDVESQFALQDEQDGRPQDGLKIGRMMEALLSADLTSKLSRYEADMQRHLGMTMKELREMQKARPDIRGNGDARPADKSNDNEDDWIEFNGRKEKRMRPP